MRVLNATEAQNSLFDLLSYVSDSGEPVKIVKGGGYKCVLISAAKFEKMQAQLAEARELIATMQAFDKTA